VEWEWDGEERREGGWGGEKRERERGGKVRGGHADLRRARGSEGHTGTTC